MALCAPLWLHAQSNSATLYVGGYATFTIKTGPYNDCTISGSVVISDPKVVSVSAQPDILRRRLPNLHCLRTLARNRKRHGNVDRQQRLPIRYQRL